MDTSNNATTNAQEQASGTLILIRHAESEWNALGKWTGRTDVHITPAGREQAAKLGTAIKDIDLHHAYTSEQIRTIETFTHLFETADNADIPVEHSGHLNERDYGSYTGLNKWEVLEEVGEDTFAKIRRSWDHPIPEGETMKMVHERAVPFYKEHILPKLLAGKNVVVVSHGNTIRALIKYLEDISDEAIAETEMPFGTVVMYRVTNDGKQHTKEVRTIDIDAPHA
ncbi:MAG TPA: 2,3-bisphosphoglycerate-dependent phosphoglycerate mutase [Candidatus Saccharimonadales bacterium]|nr:2,3-bisphosphoglycerate-dependent phosphoglycerate mutase [Candidatus Saccharimonadales bacterium]